MTTVISVKQLNSYVRSVLDSDSRLANVYVAGEISNFKSHFASGHIYFSLKDNDASVKAVMFRMNASRLKFSPENGMQVICRCRASIYDKDGQFQLYVEDMQPDGAGSLAIQFEQLKKKLEAEGLFSSSRKRRLPKYPKKIAVVTSSDAAALRDIINVLSRRNPLVSVLLVPVPVQGDYAAKKIVSALLELYNRSDYDLIIIGRGGGSAEELSAFNDENLARTICKSPVPVISAVGHETDFTICDFVADLRAPTPSAAAELAVEDINLISNKIFEYQNQIRNRLLERLENAELRLDRAANSPYLTMPDRIISAYSMHVDSLCKNLESALNSIVFKNANVLSACAARLDAMSPLKVLARGYSIATDDNNNVVNSVLKLSKGDSIAIKMADGTANCVVEKTIKD